MLSSIETATEESKGKRGVNMGSKMLTGSMLLGGMLLGIIMVFVEPSVSDTDSFAIAVQQLLDNSTQARLSGVGFTIAVLGALIGTAYLARSMQGEQKPGSDLAGLASVFAFLAAAVVTVSAGIQLSLMDASYTDRGGDVANAYAISEGLGFSMFGLLGAAMFLLGIAIVRQKNLNQIVGGLTALSGAFFLFGMLMPGGDPSLAETSTAEAIGGISWFIGFLSWIIMTMVLGGLTIKQARD